MHRRVCFGPGGTPIQLNGEGERGNIMKKMCLCSELLNMTDQFRGILPICWLKYPFQR